MVLKNMLQQKARPSRGLLKCPETKVWKVF
jgi:hypothetical protein